MNDLQRDALREARGPELLRLVHGRHAAFGDLVDELERSVIVQQTMRVDHQVMRGAGGAGDRSARGWRGRLRIDWCTERELAVRERLQSIGRERSGRMA